MAKTYKGWTRVSREDAPSYGRNFTFWHKEGFPVIIDFMDGTSKGWCDPWDRYDITVTYPKYISNSFRKLSQAIEFAERYPLKKC